MAWPFCPVSGTCPEVCLNEIGNPLAAIKTGNVSLWVTAAIRLHDHHVPLDKLGSVWIFYSNFMESKLKHDRAKIFSRCGKLLNVSAASL